MILEIFSNWLEDINKKFARENRKVLFFIDNCTAHCDLELSNVKIFLYPANCTSTLQPLDQSIIRSFKVLYTKRLIQSILSRIESNEKSQSFNTSLNVLDACYWIKYCWDSVSASLDFFQLILHKTLE